MHLPLRLPLSPEGGLPGEFRSPGDVDAGDVKEKGVGKNERSSGLSFLTQSHTG